MNSTYEWKDPRPSRAAKPVAKSGHGHFVVQMVLHDSDEDPGQISMCGSLGEYHTRVIALAEPDTIDVIEQVGPFQWKGDDEEDEDGKQSRKGKTKKKKKNVHDHYIDQVVIKTGDRRLGLTDKPYRRVTKAFEAQIAQVEADAKEKGAIDHLYLVTEYARNPIKLYNADLFRGCRDAEPEVDQVVAEVVADLAGERSLQDLVGQVNRGPRGFRALVRLIRSGQLQMVREEKISHATMVRRGSGHCD